MCTLDALGQAFLSSTSAQSCWSTSKSKILWVARNSTYKHKKKTGSIALYQLCFILMFDVALLKLVWSTSFIPVYNGNRTKWSPIRSAIICMINKIGWSQSRSLICQSHAFCMVLTTKFLEERCIDDITFNKILLCYHEKQIGSMLLWVFSVIDHSRHRNAVRSSMTQSPLLRMPIFFSYHISMCSLISYWTETLIRCSCHLQVWFTSEYKNYNGILMLKSLIVLTQMCS